METTIPTLSAEQGRVYFYRSSSFVGAAVQPSIRLDGAEVGKSQPGGFFYVDAKSGNHEAATATEVENKLTFVLDKGEVKYVRTKVTMGLMVGHVTPELVSPEEAKKEMVDLHYNGVPASK